MVKFGLWVVVFFGIFGAPGGVTASTVSAIDIQASNSPEAGFLRQQYSLCPGPDHGLLRAKNPFLYKWVGTYYNGVIETTITLDNSSVSCLSQTGTFNRTLSAVLSIIDSRYHVAPGNWENPFVFLLNGWIPDVPFFGENLVPSQMPSGVLVDFESIRGFRGESNGGKYGEVSSGSVVDLSVGRSGDGWGVSGSYVNSTSKPLEADDSVFVYEFPTCNATQYANFVMRNYPATNESTPVLTGAFSPLSAEFSLSGRFAGHFDSWKLGDHKLDFARDKVQYGRYKMVFKGVVDRMHSHGLVVGSQPSWEPDVNKTKAYACVQSGAGRREGVRWGWVFGVVISVVWLGI